MANIWYGALQYPAGRSSPSDGNWRNTNNWYLSVGQDGANCCTVTDAVPANRVPTNADSVYLFDGTVDITTGPSSTFSGSITTYGSGGARVPALSAGTFTGNITGITVGGGTYSTGSMNVVTFNAGNASGVMTSCIINGGSTSGTLTSCTINGGANSGAFVSCIFNAGTYGANMTIGGAGGTAVFNGNITCTGAVQGTAIFNGTMTFTGAGRITGGSPTFNGATTLSLDGNSYNLFDGTPGFNGSSLTLGTSSYTPFVPSVASTGLLLTGKTFSIPVTIWVCGRTAAVTGGTSTSAAVRFFQCNFNAGLSIQVQTRCLDNAQPDYYPDIVFKNCTRAGIPFNTVYQDILGAGL